MASAPKQETGMLYPQEDAKAWAERYGFKTSGKKCASCGRFIRFTTPFVFKEARGLISDHDECGEEYRQTLYLSMDPEFNEAVKGLFELLRDGSER